MDINILQKQIKLLETANNLSYAVLYQYTNLI